MGEKGWKEERGMRGWGGERKKRNGKASAYASKEQIHCRVVNFWKGSWTSGMKEKGKLPASPLKTQKGVRRQSTKCGGNVHPATRKMGGEGVDQ